MQAKESLVSYVLLLFASAMFESTLAQESTVNCASGPCKNFGTCQGNYIGDTFLSYDCFCRNGFSGRNCEVRVFTSTVSTPTTYFTEQETKMATISPKSSTGFRASYCSLNTPCQNGGSCTDGATEGEYQCKCPVGFEGKDCQYFAEQPEETREIVLTDDSCERKVSVGIPQVKYMATLSCDEGTIYVKSVVYGAGKHWTAWIEQIGKICNFKAQCKVAAKENMFDDPFSRVYKRLIIVYDCGTMTPKSSDPGL